MKCVRACETGGDKDTVCLINITDLQPTRWNDPNLQNCDSVIFLIKFKITTVFQNKAGLRFKEQIISVFR